MEDPLYENEPSFFDHLLLQILTTIGLGVLYTIDACRYIKRKLTFKK